ncbi:putative quinol monooxygenase [Blastococcus sp. TF02A-26]|uniref:putative quinol monooxygenase n=1 Tax=Blastococcus sp. TF02A-26 TaxID=2250577 RepID=UPI000DE836FF|nr:putative quinol monooxygenase [Blastococcus sp. TF02A-26]RBY86193.1 antibiotic biosynthesis monooxygenase [Blastococcus sp. TF02A-26]
MSVVVVAHIRPLPEHLDAVKQAFLDILPEVHAEPGCELYALHEADGVLVMIEKWESREALNTHMTAPALTAIGPKLAGKVSGAPEVQLLDPLPAGTKGAL